MQTTEKLTRRYPLFDISDTMGKPRRSVLSDFIENGEILEILSQVIDKDSNIGGIEGMTFLQHCSNSEEYKKALSEIFLYKLTPGLEIYWANSSGASNEEDKSKKFIFYSLKDENFLLPQYGTRSCISACACMLIGCWLFT